MLMNPDLMLDLAHDRRRDLIAEADRGRLLAAARLARRGRKARPTATLRPCEPSVAVPAR